MKRILFFLLLVSSFAHGQGGDYYKQRKTFPVEFYGAVGNGVTDDHVAIQRAVLAADAAGGGDVLFQQKVYYTGTGLVTSLGGLDYNCQIYIPYDTSIVNSINFKTIRLIGVQGDCPSCQTSPLGYQKVSYTGTVLLSGYIGTHSTSKALTAVIGTTAPAGAFATTNGNAIIVNNITIVVKNNPNGAGPEIGGINYHDGLGFDGDHISVLADTSGTVMTQPSRNIAGIVLPGNARGAAYSLTNSSASSFYWGVIAGEHSYLNQVTAFQCYNGFGIPWMSHSAGWGRVSSNWCHNGLYMPYDDGSFPQTAYLSISEFDQEVGSGNTGGIAWINQNKTIMDSANLLRANINYLGVIQNSAGAVNSQFTMTGGTFIDTIAVGSPRWFISSSRMNTKWGLTLTQPTATSDFGIKMAASSATAYGITGQNTDTTGYGGYELQNNRGSYAMFAGLYVAPSVGSVLNGNLGVVAQDWAELQVGGANAAGLAVGTRTPIPLVFSTNNTEKGRFTPGGVFELGGTNVAGHTFGSGFTAVERTASNLMLGDVGDIYQNSNIYWDGTNYKAVLTGPGAQIKTYNGEIVLSTAPSVSAGATAGLVQRWKIDVNGTYTGSARLETGKGANVASTGNLTLGTDGNVFHITGTTTINAITIASWQAGSTVKLIFDASVTVKNNTAGGGGTAVMLLSGGTDFSATANDVLTLVYDGTSWFEQSRSVN